MRDMRESGVEWIGEIPSSWEIIANKHLMKKVKNIRNKYTGEDVLSLTMRGVIVRDLENPSGKMPATFDGYQFVEAGNLLMCLFDIDVTPRCIGLIKNDGVCSPAYSQFQMSDKADAGFYYYYYLNLDHTKELLHLAKNLRHSLTEEQLGAVPTALPPIEEQRKIVVFLDEKLVQVDSLIANVQAQIEKLKSYKQSLITEVVTKGLDPAVPMKDSGVEWIGEIPAHWDISRIKYIAAFDPACDKTDILPESTITYTPMDCIKNGWFINNTARMDSVTSSLTQYQDGDIVMAKVTPCFENGNIAIMENLSNGFGMGSSELFVFRARDIETKYLFYWLRNDLFMKLGKATMTGTGGLKRVSPTFVKNCPIHIPPKSDQQMISAHLDEKCAQIDRLIAIKQAKIEKLEQYKRSLIYEYVTGKKEVLA